MIKVIFNNSKISEIENLNKCIEINSIHSKMRNYRTILMQNELTD